MMHISITEERYVANEIGRRLLGLLPFTSLHLDNNRARPLNPNAKSLPTSAVAGILEAGGLVMLAVLFGTLLQGEQRMKRNRKFPTHDARKSFLKARRFFLMLQNLLKANPDSALLERCVGREEGSSANGKAAIVLMLSAADLLARRSTYVDQRLRSLQTIAGVDIQPLIDLRNAELG